MAAPQTGREFVDLLKRSQLLDAGLLSKVVPQLEKHAEATPQKLALTLVKNSLVTEFQCRQLMSGRYKGFYLAKYKLLELVGSGGMGKVFLAEQITMERLVAIKLIGKLSAHKDKQKEILARFAREARAVAALRHPNIIHAYDFDTADGVPYIVMEYVEGLDTANLVGKFGPIPWPQAAEYIRQAALGLQHAHQAGMVHRDIKPGNLLVDAEGQVKILDLGLCSAFDAGNSNNNDSLTVDQDQLGTVDYIAPEQALDSHKVDARADIYSLGGTFYGILTGQPMYPGKSTAQKLLLHQTTDPTPIEQLRSDVPPELTAIVSKMLKKNPNDRFQTAADLEAALAPFAKVVTPPYDLTAIKHRRSDYEPYLRKSPPAHEISVQTFVPQESGPLKTDTPATSPTAPPSPTPSAKVIDAPVPKPRGPASMISMKTPPQPRFTEAELEEETSELALPSRIVKRKSKKSKKKEADGNPAAMLAIGLGGIVLLGGLVWLLTPRSSTPTSTLASVNASVPAPAAGHSAAPQHAAPQHAAHGAGIPTICELKNGDLSQFGEIPAFWDWHQTQTGRIQVVRDLRDYQGKTGSLRVQTLGPPAKGFAGQYMPGGGGKSVTIRGFHKSVGSLRSSVVVRSYAANERELGVQVVRASESAGDWTNFDKTLSIPIEAQGIAIGLDVEGQGQAWLDEVSISGDGFRMANDIFITDKYEQWRYYTQQLRNDPDLIAYFPLAESGTRGAKVSNFARRGPKGELEAHGVGSAMGRWPQKQGLSYDGGQKMQYAELSSDMSNALQFQQSSSVALWFKPKEYEYHWQTLVAKSDSCWRIQRDATKSEGKSVVFHTGDHSESERLKRPLGLVSSKTRAEPGQWWHVVGVFDANSEPKMLRIYLNGVLEEEAPCDTPKANKSPVWLGANSAPQYRDTGEIRTWNGVIDEFAAWSRALTLDEVQQLYTRGKP